MHIRHLGWLSVAVLLAGCATPPLPRGAQLVGGGLMVEYEARRDGVAILIERTSGRIVATESLSEGGTFSFHPNRQGYDEVLFRMFGNAQTTPEAILTILPTNAFFQLYFVPDKAQAD